MFGQHQVGVTEHGIDHRRQNVNEVQLGLIPLGQVKGRQKG